MLDILAQGVQGGEGFKKVGRAVLVQIPFRLPVVRQHGFNVEQHAALHVDRYAAVKILAVHLHPVGVPCVLRDQIPAFQAIDRQGQQMLFGGVFHENVVGLIPYVRAVAVRAVGRQIAVLVDVHDLGGNALIAVGLVERIDELLHVAQLDGRVVFQHVDHGALFQLSVKAGGNGLIPLAPLGEGRRAGAQQRKAEKQCKRPFHGLFLLDNGCVGIQNDKAVCRDLPLPAAEAIARGAAGGVDEQSKLLTLQRQHIV